MGGVIAVDAAEVAAISELDHGFDGDALLGGPLVKTRPESLVADLFDLWWLRRLVHVSLRYACLRRKSITRASLTKAKRYTGRLLRSSSPNRRANSRASRCQNGKNSC